MLFVVHTFFPARTAEMKHVHRLKLKEIQWKTETQFEAANVGGQEIFSKNIMPHRKINMQLRGNDTRVTADRKKTADLETITTATSGKANSNSCQEAMLMKGWLFVVLQMLAKFLSSHDHKLQKLAATLVARLYK